MVFPRKVASLGQIDDFSSFFTKLATFSTFLLKSWPKRGNMVVCWKSCNFWPNRWCFIVFHEMSHFLQLFAEKLTKTPKHGSFLEELQVLAKSMIFRAFSRNEPFFQLFSEKMTKTPKHGSFVEKLQVLGKSRIFRAFGRNESLFATFCWKVHQNAETW